MTYIQCTFTRSVGRCVVFTNLDTCLQEDKRHAHSQCLCPDYRCTVSKPSSWKDPLETCQLTLGQQSTESRSLQRNTSFQLLVMVDVKRKAYKNCLCLIAVDTFCGWLLPPHFKCSLAYLYVQSCQCGNDLFMFLFSYFLQIGTFSSKEMCRSRKSTSCGRPLCSFFFFHCLPCWPENTMLCQQFTLNEFWFSSWRAEQVAHWLHFASWCFRFLCVLCL